MPKKPANILLYLGEVHDFLRALYFLRSGMTSRQFSKLMSVDDSWAVARLKGWEKLGVVEKREDGKYYLRASRVVIEGFGEIRITDDSIQLFIDPTIKFRRKARSSPDTIRVEVYP